MFFLFICSRNVFAAQEAVGERIAERLVVSPSQIERQEYVRHWFFSTFYEPSKVVQGSRPGRWLEVTNRIGYNFKKAHVYASVSQFQRFDQKDDTANFGIYFPLNGYFIHEEIGFGWDVDFMYKLQNVFEISHKLYKNLFWQLGYNYRGYPRNDNYTAYPGLIYYFGNNYIGLDYGASTIEGRGFAQFGVLKSDFEITKSLHWSLGAAVGERLYDIYGLEASKEYGYIIFTGFSFDVFEWMNFRIGYSYGTEKPDFIKRSANFNLTLKF